MVEGLAIASVVCIVMVVFLSFFVFTGYFVAKPAPGANALAKCLTYKNATVYVSKYCSHCAEQKALFGDAFSLLNSIDCADDQQACARAGVGAVPTWSISGKHYEGTQTLERLAELSGCAWNS